MQDIIQPPAGSSLEQDEQDPDPFPEDEEFFEVPDAESKEEAINKFLDGLEGQERCGFKDMHIFLDCLPVPVGKEIQSMHHAEARAGQFLPDMDEDRNDLHHWNSSCTSMQWNTGRYLYILVYCGIYWDILVLVMYILVYTGIYRDVP
jgi:hypothetical protein